MATKKTNKKTSKNVSEIIESEETEVAKEEKQYEELMTRLHAAAFHAYMQIDFTDITDMLNYRGDSFSDVMYNSKNADSEESLESIYIVNKPGNYEVKEIQEYIYYVIQEALNRFNSQLHESREHNEPVVGEYYNYKSGIYCQVTEDGVEIHYAPVSSYGSIIDI